MRRDTAPGTTRRALVAGAAALVAGCVGDNGDGGDGAGDNGDDAATPDSNPATGEVTQMGDLTLTSPTFDDGEQIPDRYGYTVDNVNPPLEVKGVPEGAESMALLVDDPDAVEPAGTVWDHWVVWNIPPTRTTVPEGWEPSDAVEGTNDYGEVGYGGPNPPDREHRYRFKLFALETTFDLPAATDAEALGEAMDGHVLAQTQLDGTYPA
jgi:Raf kinase inhibitor-like YbhB/YbcL family protein